MKNLYVFFEQLFVGTLTRDDDLIFSFSYDKIWQTSPHGFPLSIVMPLSQTSYGNKITLSFFENLLPEGEVKENLQRSHGVTGVFDFLQNYGKDCAGAITISDKIDYQPNGDNSQLAPIDMERIYAAIDEKTSVADFVADMNPGYLSLAGAQDKFPTVFEGNNFYIPTGGSPTTHIVKAPIQHSGIKESVFNEYYCMELARAVGFHVPKCTVLNDKHPLFIIERYDRRKDAHGNVHRIHQQDFCQAQGITSEFKYEDKGGPSIKQNFQLIRDHIRPQKRLEGIEIFLDWICFNSRYARVSSEVVSPLSLMGFTAIAS